MNHDKLKQQLDRLGQELSPDDSIAGKVMSRLGESSRKPVRPTNVWRIIMKSKIAQLGSLAAALIIAAVIWTHSQISKPVYGMADVHPLVNRASSYHLVGRVFHRNIFAHQTGDTVATPLEQWFDREKSRWRVILPYYGLQYEKDGGFTVRRLEEICFGDEFILNLNHTDKTARYHRVSPYYKKVLLEQKISIILSVFFGKADELGDYRLAGREFIDGQPYDIWELEVDIIEDDTSFVRLRSWLSPATGRFGKARMWLLSKDDPEEWRMYTEIDLFEQDVEVPDEVFHISTEDYTFENSQATAEELRPHSGGTRGDDVVVKTNLSFALPDHSVILCWTSWDEQADIPHGRYFDGTTFGGPVPMLPFCIDRLYPLIDPQAPPSEGVHLTHTVKDGVWYSWDLYVPIDPKQRYGLGLYAKPQNTVTYRKVRFESTNPVNPIMTIQDEGLFQEIVLGGLREMSDDEPAAEGLTLASLLDLAQQTREGMQDRDRKTETPNGQTKIDEGNL